MRKFLPILMLPGLALAANPQIGFNELAANQAQPHITINAADRAISNVLAGEKVLNVVTDANIAMSTSQWQFGTIRITDTGPVLTTNRDVIYPNVDAFTGGTSRATFLFKNATARTLTVKRSGQTGVAVLAGASALLHHNGTDIEAVSSAGGGGGAPDDAKYITQTPDSDLSAEQALSALSTGIVKNTTTTGVLSIAAAGTDYYAPGSTDVAFADGGTGLSSASDDQTLVSSGAAWVAKTLPDCTDTGGNHLNYTQSTNAFSCGTSGGGGGGTPGGSNTQVQFNDSSAFGGDADFLWNKTTNTITLGSTATNGMITAPVPGTNVNGNSLSIIASAGGASGANGGAVIVRGGAATNPGVGGTVFIDGGVGFGADSGHVTLRTSDGATEIISFKSTGSTTVAGSACTSDFPLIGNPLSCTNALNVATAVQGTLHETNGGTGVATVTQGDLLYGSAANTWSKLAKSATATRYLANTGTSNNPAWAQVNVANGVTGTLPQANRLRTVRTVTAAGAITGAATDEIICVNKTSGAATTVNLHGSPATGFEYTIKDCKGDAGSNNITVTPAAGNIDGSVSYVISANYGAVTLFYNGSQWFSR